MDSDQTSRGKIGITNDVAWYKNYPILTHDVASLFMSRPNGVDYPDVNTTGIQYGYYKHQGGFLRSLMLPTWGATGEFDVPSSPLNTAASKLYYFVVHGNSRNISYDKGDLMKCYMAYDAVIMMLEEAKRAYKCIRGQSVSNRWVKRLVSCLGWDYDDLTNNIVRFRQVINLAAIKLNQISIPDVFDMFKCHRELFQWIYYDRASGKPQFMANVSRAAWIYSDVYSELEAFEYGKLPGDVTQETIYWNPNHQLRTVRTFEKLINFMINSLYDSTDIGVMQGDLKRAFTTGQMIEVELLREEEDLPITASLEYNLMLHNAEFFDCVSEYTTSWPNPTGTYLGDVHATAVIRDRILMDGNMEFGICVGAEGQAPADISLKWDTFKGNHIMDLIDDWNEDADAVLLMQKYKWRMLVNSGFRIHAQEGAEGAVYAAVPDSCGPAIITTVQYFFNPEGLDRCDFGRVMLMNNDPNFNNNQKHMTMLKLYELGVTLQIVPIYYNDDTSTSPGPMTYEVENVTVYNHKVLWNIQNSMIESLWYNPALYNLG